MQFDITKIFPRGKKPDVLILTKRNMMLPVDGTSQHVPAGSTVTIAHDDFRQLDQADFELVNLNQPKVEIADPTPAKPAPEPLPAAWLTLPDCFRVYHETEAEIAASRAHIRLIQDKRLELFGTNTDFSKSEGTILAGRVSVSGDTRDRGVYSSLKPLNFDDPVMRKLARFLANSEEAAKDHLNRLLETSDISQQRRFLECGTCRIDVAEELQELIAELADTGFKIFSLRLQALGLAESHLHKLYSGSADFVRYGTQSPAYVGGCSWGGMAEDGRMRRYSDLPVESSAGHLLRDRARIDELKPLVKAAKAELSKAQKASMPAGLAA